MNTIDTDFKKFLIEYTDGSDYVQQLNRVVEKLVANDVAMTVESSKAPGIWQYRWRSGQNGYAKNEAVWINSDTTNDVIANYRDEIEDFIKNSYELRELCAKAQDQNEFYRRIVEGTAVHGLSALFWTGDVTKKAQVRMSKIDNNNTYPDSDDWEDFFQMDDDATSTGLILSCLSGMLDARLSAHAAEYHQNFNQYDPDDYIEKSVSAISGIPSDGMQQYFDHTYTIETRGIDYVSDQRFWKDASDGKVKKWFRRWNSGYLEFGGVEKRGLGEKSHRAEFAPPGIDGWPSFNYPDEGGKFYQSRYGNCPELGLSEIQTRIRGNLRYGVSVTPFTTEQAHSYRRPLNEDGRRYVSRDVFGMDNGGFSFVCDEGCAYYSYYASGFSTKI